MDQTRTKPHCGPPKSPQISLKDPVNNVGIYLQNKSSRIVFASLETTNDKIENVLSDATKYRILGEEDHAIENQKLITSWYKKSKQHLMTIKEDLSETCPQP